MASLAKEKGKYYRVHWKFTVSAGPQTGKMIEGSLYLGRCTRALARARLSAAGAIGSDLVGSHECLSNALGYGRDLRHWRAFDERPPNKIVYPTASATDPLQQRMNLDEFLAFQCPAAIGQSGCRANA